MEQVVNIYVYSGFIETNNLKYFVTDYIYTSGWLINMCAKYSLLSSFMYLMCG